MIISTEPSVDDFTPDSRSYQLGVTHGKAQMAWKPITTAPRDGSRILLKGRAGKIADGFWAVEGRSWIWVYALSEPLEWMPVPGEDHGKRKIHN